MQPNPESAQSGAAVGQGPPVATSGIAPGRLPLPSRAGRSWRSEGPLLAEPAWCPAAWADRRSRLCHRGASPRPLAPGPGRHTGSFPRRRRARVMWVGGHPAALPSSFLSPRPRPAPRSAAVPTPQMGGGDSWGSRMPDPQPGVSCALLPSNALCSRPTRPTGRTLREGGPDRPQL